MGASSCPLLRVNAGLQGLLWASAAWGDYDNDGDLDVTVIGYEPVTQLRRSIVYRNDAGTFVDTGDSFHNVYLGAVKWMDFDNDGDLDLLLTGNSVEAGDVLRLYRNNNATANTAPSAPASLAANVLGTSVEVSWSAGSDAQTPAAGLSYNWRVGTAPGGSNIVAPQSSSAGYRRLAAMGNVQSRLGASVRGLVPGTTYYWSVQSVDTAFAGSAFAAEGSFTALADPPQNVSFARVAGGGIHAIWRGTPGSTYRVEASPDLQSWTPVATPAAAGTGVFEFLETPASDVGQRFYRAARP